MLDLVVAIFPQRHIRARDVQPLRPNSSPGRVILNRFGRAIVDPHAEEVINIFGLAIQHGITATAFKATIFAYPTGASDVERVI